MAIGLLACGLLLVGFLLASGCTDRLSGDGPAGDPAGGQTAVVPLPSPRDSGPISVEEALRIRRSERSYSGETLTLAEIGQLLWAAQGITDPRGYRTTPSAGALYPLEIIIVAREVAELSPGVYRYLPADHALALLAAGDRTADLQEAALGQDAVLGAPAVIVISAVPERTTLKYGQRGMRYIFMEAGHAAQNIYLQATALNLSTVCIGAFDDEAVAETVSMGENEVPLYLMPVGRRE